MDLVRFLRKNSTHGKYERLISIMKPIITLFLFFSFLTWMSFRQESSTQILQKSKSEEISLEELEEKEGENLESSAEGKEGSKGSKDDSSQALSEDSLSHKKTPEEILPKEVLSYHHPENMIEALSSEKIKEYANSIQVFSEKVISCLNEENNWCNQKQAKEDYFHPERTLYHQSLEKGLLFLGVASEKLPETLNFLRKEWLLEATSLQNNNISIYATDLLLRMDSDIEMQKNIIEKIKDIKGQPKFSVLQLIYNKSKNSQDTLKLLENSFIEIFQKKDFSASRKIIQNLSFFNFEKSQYENLAKNLCELKRVQEKDAESIEENTWKLMELQFNSQLEKKNILPVDFSQICS